MNGSCILQHTNCAAVGQIKQTYGLQVIMISVETEMLFWFFEFVLATLLLCEVYKRSLMQCMTFIYIHIGIYGLLVVQYWESLNGSQTLQVRVFNLLPPVCRATVFLNIYSMKVSYYNVKFRYWTFSARANGLIWLFILYQWFLQGCHLSKMMACRKENQVWHICPVRLKRLKWDLNSPWYFKYLLI